MKLEYVVIACDPDHRPMGDHGAREPEDAIDYARHYLDEETRDGACVIINVVGSDDQQDDKEDGWLQS